MAGLGLQQEQKVAVFLGSFVVGEESFLRVGGIIQVARDLILLRKHISPSLGGERSDPRPVHTYFFQGHSVLDQQCDSRVQVSHIFLQYEVFFGLRGDP
jgi:hypothetical protein